MHTPQPQYPIMYDMEPRPITGDEYEMYTFLAAHYRQRCACLPNCRWLKDYYKNLANILKTKTVLTLSS